MEARRFAGDIVCCAMQISRKKPRSDIEAGVEQPRSENNKRKLMVRRYVGQPDSLDNRSRNP
jgi:hypothetical protein